MDDSQLNDSQLDDSRIHALLTEWAAAELAGDVSAIVSLLAPDFVGVGPVGFALDRSQWAQRHLGDLVNTEFALLDVAIRGYGDTAVVTGVQRQVTRARGHDTSGSFRLVAVCVPDDDAHPRIVHLQLSGPLIAADQMPAFARTDRQGEVRRG